MFFNMGERFMRIKYGLFFIVLFLIFPLQSKGLSLSESNINDQVSISVAIYNNNLALVNEIRRIETLSCDGELSFIGVPADIIPESVLVRSIDNEREFTIVEQNYEYDLLNQDSMLDKYVGEKIKIVDWNKYKDRKEVTEAILLSNKGGQIYKIGSEIYIGHPGYKVLPGLPEGLTERPTLKWVYKSCCSKSPYDLSVCYLTKNMSWNSDYILMLGEDEVSADISGKVTVNNKSGADFNDAALRLVAGEIHQTENTFGERLYVKRDIKASAGDQFREQAFFEYHVYDLQKKTTIKDRQAKQINLFQARDLKVDKELVVYGNNGYFTKRLIGQNIRQPVNVYIKLKNSKENNLGIPFPAGVIRIYKASNHEGLLFIGEDRIQHIPQEEEVQIHAGEAFDIFAERTQTDYKQTTTRLYESAWEITLRNHKEEDVKVGVIETLSGNWSVVSSTHTFRKIDAFRIRFDVQVPKEKEVKIRYTAEVGL